MNQLPKDPMLLLSVVNTQLRDHFPNFSELCKFYSIEESEIENKLRDIDYEYDVVTNQFI
jgi:hypothetical protein